MKILSIITTIILSIALAGCGGGAVERAYEDDDRIASVLKKYMKKTDWWNEQFVSDYNGWRAQFNEDYEIAQNISSLAWRGTFLISRNREKEEAIIVRLHQDSGHDVFPGTHGYVRRFDWHSWIVEQIWETEPQEIIFDGTELKKCARIKEIIPSGAQVPTNARWWTQFRIEHHVPKNRYSTAWATIPESLKSPGLASYRPENPYRPGNELCNPMPHKTTISIYQTKEKEIQITATQADSTNYGEPPTPDWGDLEKTIMLSTLVYGEELGFRYAVVEQIEDRTASSTNPDEIRTTGTDGGIGTSYTYGGITFSSANTNLNQTTTTNKKGGSFKVETKQRIRYQETEPDHDNYIDLEFLKRNKEFAYRYRVE